MNVPFIDLRIQNQRIRTDVDQAIGDILDRGNFILGDDVTALEEEFARMCGVEHAVGVDSGVSALELALRGFGIGPGDEVILPANTFIASAAAVTFSGATPVLVDVDPCTHNILPEAIAAAIGPNTRAIMPVHLYGLPAEMDAITEITSQHDLLVIEDACQAHGATYNGKSTGSLGDAAGFSFYPTKNLGAYGDGGIIATNNRDVADAARAMRNCGQRVKNIHELIPYNHRLDTIQAAIIRIKLQYLDDWNDERRAVAAEYQKNLAGIDVIAPVESDGTRHVYHLFVIRTQERDQVQTYLRSKGVGSAIHYPIPIHRQPFYKQNPIKFDNLANSELICDEILSLPIYPGMTRDQVAYVCQELAQALEMIHKKVSTPAGS